jgi:hypothetical protein
MNVVDALIQEDVLLGQHLDDNGLARIRAQIMKMHETKAVDDKVIARNKQITDVPSLFNGEILQETDSADNPFGLREAPLG